MSTMPVVSVIIIAYNEEHYLDRVLHDVLRQDYPRSLIDLVLVDSASQDATRAMMSRFADHHGADFAAITVADNPARILPAGWNVALPLTKGEIITRWDAHAEFAPDFISHVVNVLKDEYVCGGPRPTKVADESDQCQELLHLVEESAFGASFAQYRSTDTGETYVDAVFHGSYRRVVFDTVGTFDERLVRTEDNDIFYRIRKAGYRIKFSPKIRSTQIIRPTVRGMIKQKFSNGYWIGKTLVIQPGAVGKHHVVPGLFVSALGASCALAITGKRLPLVALASAYALADAAMTVSALHSREKTSFNPYLGALPLAFPVIHIAYGLGTIKGLASHVLGRR